jgi:hypothetical protein
LSTEASADPEIVEAETVVVVPLKSDEVPYSNSTVVVSLFALTVAFSFAVEDAPTEVAALVITVGAEASFRVKT